MAPNDRNKWDPKTPTGDLELGTEGRVVDLHIYVFARSRKDDQMIKNDVTDAAAIWCQDTSRINIQAVRLDRLSDLPPTVPQQEGQIDLNLPDLGEQLTCALPDAIREQFLSIALDKGQDVTKSLAVFYIPGREFTNGALGCHMFVFTAGDIPPQHLIVLTDNAEGRTLAHEIGHALFVQQTGGNTWTSNDPDPNRDPANPGHNASPRNLMFPNVPNNPDITAPQGTLAQQSLLVAKRFLATGFVSPKLELGVTIKDITVHSSDDEETSDDALESSWSFTASTRDASGAVVRTSKSDTWAQDPLHFWTYTLNKTLSPLQIEADSDVLLIEVGGVDEDFGPNDTLVGINRQWKKSDALWGSTSSNVPNGPPGDQVERRSDDNIDYSLTYHIDVVSPAAQVTFRTVCGL